MSIKYRLYGGFGLLLAMTLGLVVFAVMEFKDVALSVTRMNGISENMTRAMQVEGYLEKMRRSVLRFAYDHDEPSRKENGEVAKLVAATIQEAIDSTLAQERKNIYLDVQKDFAVADAASQKLFNGVSQIDGAQAKLSKAGGALAAASSALINKVQGGLDHGLVELAMKLNAQLLTVRVISLRAQVLTNVDSMPDLADAVAMATATISAIDSSAPDDVILIADPLKGTIVDFQKGVQGVVATQHEAHDLYVNQIAPQIKKMQDKVGTLREGVQQNFNDTKASVDASIRSTILYQEIAGGLALLIACVIAFFAARSVSNPILALTGGMRELAEGNFGVVLAGLKRKDEVGAIAKAVEAFKVKAAERAQAEAEAKAEQDQQAEAERQAALAKMAD
jgi:nitrogen fixation/metabolism regulation signal transduction histidine kinase